MKHREREREIWIGNLVCNLGKKDKNDAREWIEFVTYCIPSNAFNLIF